MLFFSLGQGAERILSLRGLPRRHTVKTGGPVPPGYVLAATVPGISQICDVPSRLGRCSGVDRARRPGSAEVDGS